MEKLGGVFTYKRNDCASPDSVHFLFSDVNWSGKEFSSFNYPAQLQP